MGKFINQTGLFCLLAATLVFAESASYAKDHSTPTAEPTDTSSHGFSEQTLDAFAAAYVKVAQVYSSHAPQIKSARNPEQAHQAQVTINYKASQVIQEQGLTPDQYNEVVRTINEDPSLAQTVAQKIRALQ
jgi:hypothetical protein